MSVLLKTRPGVVEVTALHIGNVASISNATTPENLEMCRSDRPQINVRGREREGGRERERERGWDGKESRDNDDEEEGGFDAFEGGLGLKSPPMSLVGNQAVRA